MNLLIILLILLNLILTAYLASRLSEKTISKSAQIILDTSSVIDGRVLNIAQAGFLKGKTLIATNLILDELQYLADGSDSFKRARARHGLEILDNLTKLNNLNLIVKKLPEQKDLEVDQQLLNLAKKLKAQLLTTDYNLAARAKVEGVSTINPAELAEALKPQVLPGETFKLKLIQRGEDKDQAVGYLPDGTMVVAEGLQNKLGQTLELKSSKIIQTTGGRIIFASEHKNSGSSRRSSSNGTRPATTYKAPATTTKLKAGEAETTNAKPVEPNPVRAKTLNSKPRDQKRMSPEDRLFRALNKK